jgi:mannitol-1-phosphate 5-dehydrogenase
MGLAPEVRHPMKALVIGPGRIGCGFAGQLLRHSGLEVVFVARKPSMTDYFNRVGAYRVCLVDGHATQEIVVDGVRAVSSADRDQVAREITEAGLVVTAVGPGNLPDVAQLLALGIERRTTPVNLVAFENLLDAGPRLRSLVAGHLPADFPLARHGFSGALVERAVTQRRGDAASGDLLTFVGDPPASFLVDGRSLVDPLPRIQGMIVTDDYHAWIQRKLYIFSAGHATCAYLGYLKGYNYIHTAIRDPEIRATVLTAMAEAQRGLAARYGPEIAGDERHLQEIISRFKKAALNDPVVRVGRDPLRKLAAHDRLVGAARLAAEAGVRPEKLALATAAAFYFNNPADPSAAALQRELERSGLPKALDHICGLDSGRGLGRSVADRWARFAEGWENGNLLLKLDQMMWARLRAPTVSAPRPGGIAAQAHPNHAHEGRVVSNIHLDARHMGAVVGDEGDVDPGPRRARGPSQAELVDEARVDRVRSLA